MKTLISFWKPSIWLVLVCFVCLLPDNHLPKPPFLFFPHFDKVVHFGMYFILALLLVKPFSSLSKFKYLLAFLVSAVSGGLIELLQSAVTSGRSTSINDFYANLAGSFAGILFYIFYARNKKISHYL